MDTDVADRLDRSIGPAPDGPDALNELLEQGHRVVRRRRVGTTAASVATALVIVGGAALTTGGESDRATPPVAGTSSASASASPSPSPSAAASEAPPASAAWPWGEELAAFDPVAGEIVIAPGATVQTRLENPYDLEPPAGSVAMVVASRKGVVSWYAMAWRDGGGSSAAISRPGEEDQTFRQWVREMAGIVPVDAPPGGTGAGGADVPAPQGAPADDLVRFVGDTEELAATGGATVLEQRPGVDLGEDFAGPDDRTAAGVVRTASGDRLFVLVRAASGEPAQAISVPIGSVAGGDLDAFLAFARDAYAGGGGLL